MPWLIVRLPCGSRSTHSTRWPRSTNAAARLSVVVVFATPPFWFVNAMTFALASITQAVFARAGRNPSPFPSGDCATRQAARRRDRQGRGREDDRGGRARPRRGAPRKRVVLCEVAGSERMSRLVPELTTVSVDPEEAKREWLRYQLKSRTLAGVLGGSSMFQYLTAAAPGLTELVTIGKVWDLAQLEPRAGTPAFDLAIVDAPATGHGLAMLRAPSTYATIARVGPVGRHAETDRLVPARPASDRRARRRAAGGDAGERDGGVRAGARPRARHGDRRDPRERGAPDPLPAARHRTDPRRHR